MKSGVTEGWCSSTKTNTIYTLVTQKLLSLSYTDCLRFPWPIFNLVCSWQQSWPESHWRMLLTKSTERPMSAQAPENIPISSCPVKTLGRMSAILMISFWLKITLFWNQPTHAPLKINKMFMNTPLCFSERSASLSNSRIGTFSKFKASLCCYSERLAPLKKIPPPSPWSRNFGVRLAFMNSPFRSTSSVIIAR